MAVAAWDVDVEQVRRRKPLVARRTLSVRDARVRALARSAAEYPPSINAADPRPREFAECEARGLGAATPCPYVSCAMHLYLDVADNGSIKLNFPDHEPDELAETCALRVAARGGATLEAVGDMLGRTREWIRRIEVAAFEALRAHLPAEAVAALAPDARPDPWGEDVPDHSDLVNLRQGGKRPRRAVADVADEGSE